MDGDPVEPPRELPLEILDDIVLLSGWRNWGRIWSKTCKRYRNVDWWLQEGAPHDSSASLIVVEPGKSINAAINAASRKAAAFVFEFGYSRILVTLDKEAHLLFGNAAEVERLFAVDTHGLREAHDSGKLRVVELHWPNICALFSISGTGEPP